MRLFVGVPLPEKARRAIVEVKRAFEQELHGIKFVEDENLHITLKFLGEVREDKAKKVVEALRGISFRPFSVTARGVGGFPTSTRPRVIWVGVEEEGELTRLAKNVENALSALGFPPEARTFHPHITIGRVRREFRAWGALRARMEMFARKEFCSFVVDRFVLFRSTLTPKGPIYEEIARFLATGKEQTF